jgi:hypothetical protein
MIAADTDITYFYDFSFVPQHLFYEKFGDFLPEKPDDIIKCNKRCQDNNHGDAYPGNNALGLQADHPAADLLQAQ